MLELSPQNEWQPKSEEVPLWKLDEQLRPKTLTYLATPLLS